MTRNDNEVILDQLFEFVLRNASQDISLAISCIGTGWSVMCEWGKEAEDSPMAGAAAFGAGDTLIEAVTQLLAEAHA